MMLFFVDSIYLQCFVSSVNIFCKYSGIFCKFAVKLWHNMLCYLKKDILFFCKFNLHLNSIRSFQKGLLSLQRTFEELLSERAFERKDLSIDRLSIQNI